MANLRRGYMYAHGARVNGASRNTYLTPFWVVDQLPNLLGREYYDPCPSEWRGVDGSVHTRASSWCNYPDGSGLDTEWGKYNFLNPPFSGTWDWLRKAYLESLRGSTTLAFTKFDVRTRWGRFLIQQSDWYRVVVGYTRFLNLNLEEQRTAPFQTCFAAFGGGEKLLRRVEETYGERLAHSRL